MTTRKRIQSRLNRSKRYVFTRDDFKDIASYDQIGRVLRALTEEGTLLRVGYGVYTKARRNIITGKIMPASPGGSAAVLTEALKRLNVDYKLTGATDCYYKGKSTQIPVSLEIKTSPRFKRTLMIGKSKINA
ncbi:TPA: S-adenosylhomocysteine hydrolase [Klebsiella oxytoca]|uniref:S-adenosylhomocysteine hydrolase n=1 Tax=Klebsiella oxytoca TaxID=571 RepID=A0AAN5RGX5_KLEOX|nr:S-adenosylhomocysteine hydrolase [Klebsiella oxytoca]